MKTVHQLLKELDACSEAKLWASSYKTIEEILKNVNRGDWVLWLAKRVDIDIKPLTLAKARCAKTVIHLMKDQRSIHAVNIAEKFGLTDEVTVDDLKNASAAAYAAYDDADAAAYASAAADADAAAYATAAAYTAADTDAAAYATADAAAYAAADAKNKNQKRTADICRKILGKLIIKKVNKLLNK